MITANANSKINTFKVAALTIASLVIMGYLNALALHNYELRAMISAQSGAIIWLGIYAGWGEWGRLIGTLGLFFGFMIGAVFALYTQRLFANKRLQFFYNWTAFILPIVLYPILMQYVVPPVISFFVLGFSAGATLGFFRRVYHMEINTSMATANVRFLGLAAAEGFFKKDTRGKNARATFWVFFAAVFAFAFGAFVYVMFARIDNSLSANVIIGLYRGTRYCRISGQVIHTNIVVIIGLVLMCALPYFLCPAPHTTPKEPLGHSIIPANHRKADDAERAAAVGETMLENVSADGTVIDNDEH
ncbi:MAG: DUF1275 domain-containing protein [Firmicutes bacterium]|nr:DUF1275 domain-containing protein [Bacillota bacterium]